jgi:hypothetical protein
MDSIGIEINTGSREFDVAKKQPFAKPRALPRLKRSKPDAAVTAQLESFLPVFEQTWWQTIARGQKPLRIEQVTRRGMIVGRLSYVTSKNKVGFVIGTHPFWTHACGPWISDALSDSEKSEVLEELLSKLPKHISFNLICHPRKNDAALLRKAFEKAGFTVAIQNTYTQAPDDTHVMRRLNIEQRKNIIRAAKKLRVIDLGAVEFMRFYSGNLEDIAMECYAPLEVARDLIAEGMRRKPQQVRVFAALRREALPGDETYPLDAAIACAWDRERYYYVMSTRKRRSIEHPEWKPNADAVKLLIVHAMEHARSMGLVFDADGVTELGTETLYRDILKMPELEHRYLLKREFGLYTLYMAFKSRIATLIAQICGRSGVPRGEYSAE